MKRLIKYFEAIMPFFAMEIIQLIIVYTLNILYGILLGFQIGAEKGGGVIGDQTAYGQAIEEAMSQNIVYMISVLAVIVSGIVFFFWYRFEIRGEVRGSLRHLFAGKNVISFVLLGIGCQLLLSGFMSLIQPLFIKIFDDYAQQVEKLTSGSGILVVLLTIFIAPIAEELVFRGVILHKTMKTLPFLGANILQALLFGIYHWNLVQGFYAALMGLLLGLIYHRFKTIFAPMLLHMLINASAFIAILLPNTTLSYLIMVVVGGLFVTINLFLIKPLAAAKLRGIEDILQEKQ
ncbi:MAG: hypothetical protein K0S01_72 [Herbinix sp.]|jgi:membrane protease YdiL (CAAX protease family)|nr:hypothetical protein [Herbinix sp.]